MHWFTSALRSFGVYCAVLMTLTGCACAQRDELTRLAESVPVYRVETNWHGTSADVGSAVLLPNGHLRLTSHQLRDSVTGELNPQSWIRVGDEFVRYTILHSGSDPKHGDDWVEISTSPQITAKYPPIRVDFDRPVPPGTPVYLVAYEFTRYGDDTPSDPASLKRRAVAGPVIARPLIGQVELHPDTLLMDTASRECSYRGSGGAVVMIDRDGQPVIIGTASGVLYVKDPRDPNAYAGQLFSRGHPDN